MTQRLFERIVVAGVWTLWMATAAVLPPGFSEAAISAGAVSNPTAFEIAPDGRVFICEQGGAVRIVKDGVLLATPFATFSVDPVGERGLLGVAFDPNFASNRYVYFYYTTLTAPKHNRVVRVTANGDAMLAGSESLIFRMNDLTGATNHHGGSIHFGLDGKLYVAVGDNATSANAQTLNNLLGKVLRIDSDGSIPRDNLSFGTGSGDNRALWTIGLRNPFTFAVQPGAGRILINDVGQNSFEEINDGFAGSNYGWPVHEGPSSNPAYRSPLHAYPHAGGPITGCAISGGAFYNPPVPQFLASYTGKYFFADLCGDWIRVLDLSNQTQSSFASSVSAPVDLKTGHDGSLYYLSRGAGMVFRVTSDTPAGAGMRGDFDNNGRPDVVWQNESTRQVGAWYMGGAQGATYQGFGWLAGSGVPGWSVVALADLDGNGKPDLIWQNDTTRQAVVWYMGGTKGDQYQSFAWLQLTSTPGWSIVSAADVNANGKPDLIWQEDSTRRVGVWYMGGAQGNQFQSFAWLDGVGVPGWSVVAATDLDGNGNPDLIWQNDATRQVVAWYMGGSGGSQYLSFSWLESSTTPGWRVVGAVDLDWNSKADLIWQEDSTRKVGVWYMGGPLGNQFQFFGWLEQNGIPGWHSLAAR